MSLRWAAVTVVMLGCSTGTVASFVTAPSVSEPSEGDVALFVEGQGPPGDFVEIAVVQTKVFDNDAELALDLLRDEAERLGCSAVVEIRTDVGERSAAASGICGRLDRP